MKDSSPLTRREFLNYAWFTTLGFVFALAGCDIPIWLLPQKEKKPIPKSFILFASSMGLDIGRRLEGEQLLDMSRNVTEEESLFLTDKNHQTFAYIHGKSGARISDVITWIQNDAIPDNNAQDIFIIIGGNEVASEIPKEALANEAAKIVDLATAANNRFNGKKIHFILPPPTLLDKDDPKFEYEARRQIFNPAVIMSLKEASNKGEINNISSPITLDDLVVYPSVFRDARHFREEVIDAIIQQKIINQIH